MKNNYTYRIPDSQKMLEPVLIYKKQCHYITGALLALLFSQKSNAQFVNVGAVKVSKEAVLSVHMDYHNTVDGNFINDGNTHIFENWSNDGTVNYSDQENGKTFYTGKQNQQITGSGVSNFQNIIFDNATTLVPFQLATTLDVNTNANFLMGVIDADSYKGKMIFNENADHINASDLSFVDGQVQKRGDALFEFPVGDDIYFRPSYHAQGSSIENVYTTQYFYKDSDSIHSHKIKDDKIELINNAEYWMVSKDKGSEKIVLSLSIDSATTPSEFLNTSADNEVVIVRWDETSGMWVNEGGVTSDRAENASRGAGYTQLVTAQVSAYGMFTMGLVKKTVEPASDIIVYNAVSPNGDGINDTFHIKGIDQYPDNSVEIYNRWGVKVYDQNSYNETDRMFGGYSDGRSTVNRGEKLPTGTYFYILNYKNKQGDLIKKSGYLYINNQ